MRRSATLVLSILLAASPALGVDPDDGTDVSPLTPFDFLLGHWEVGGSAPGTIAGSTSFEQQLNNKIVVRSVNVNLPPTKDRAAASHRDLMIIYATPDRHLRADYFDSDGKVIHYMVEPIDGGVVFTSEPSPGIERSRLTYRLAYAGIVSGEQEVAAPGEPEETFKSYDKWTMKRPAGKSK
jgi:hypothetical protein